MKTKKHFNALALKKMTIAGLNDSEMTHVRGAFATYDTDCIGSLYNSCTHGVIPSERNCGSAQSWCPDRCAIG